jgi:hypothetical protein
MGDNVVLKRKQRDPSAISTTIHVENSTLYWSGFHGATDPTMIEDGKSCFHDMLEDQQYSQSSSKKCRYAFSSKIGKKQDLCPVSAVEKVHWTPCVKESLKLDLVSLPKTVYELNFSGCRLSPHHVATICQFLESNTTIRTLNLADTDLRESASYKHIAGMLSKNKSLRRLDLSKNHLGWEESYPLYKGCQPNRTIQELILNQPDFDHSDPVSLVVMLTLWSGLFQYPCSSLTTLSIGSSQSCRLSPHLYELWQDICRNQEQLVSLGCRNLETNPSVQYWLSLNRYKIRQITRNCDTHACQQALLKIAEDSANAIEATFGNCASALYHLLRNNPHAIYTYEGLRVLE